ncbi:hypothetical protein MPTK1_6g10170 [Marchantia polymorpha subsp. ruderalis]|uniref:Uncharacterized protein n=2 Tax=Marchantia polymorpha TaxID=3197 RepID=A0AAF6BQH7_MARPO|nr:hypothetical protein MARPO_0016s0060 [Marchantia polymorpha]BBN14261.1 hypothetical protein Mp_6g10170 [Marchantia polymorpha subsp. ruderalis]|eukprot:PTQ44996.1 hypothetical protein MARPO_0016s0060 [Marchantia polymorpha]
MLGGYFDNNILSGGEQVAHFGLLSRQTITSCAHNLTRCKRPTKQPANPIFPGQKQVVTCEWSLLEPLSFYLGAMSSFPNRFSGFVDIQAACKLPAWPLTIPSILRCSKPISANKAS